jgi:hypothetical protein
MLLGCQDLGGITRANSTASVSQKSSSRQRFKIMLDHRARVMIRYLFNEVRTPDITFEREHVLYMQTVAHYDETTRLQTSPVSAVCILL